MSEKPAVPDLTYVQFAHPVSIGGDAGTITAWSKDKHANLIDIEEKGNWILLFEKRAVDKDGVRHYIRTGRRRRIPITSVHYIGDEVEVSEYPSVQKRELEREAKKAAKEQAHGEA